MDEKEIKVIEILKKYNQNHIINFLNKLNSEDKERLENQILKIDFEEIIRLYENAKKNIDFRDKKIEPIEYLDKEKLPNEIKNRYIEIGKKTIKEGKYAFATMAGGQGTRLGCNGPKGKFFLKTDIGDKSLFEILSDTLKIENEKYGVVIPWYIMTSKENNDETIAFFKDNEYFGYPKEDIKFFEQNELPLIDANGKLIIGKDNLIKEASDGNGGIYESMLKNGILDDMNKRNVEWLFIGGVDNVLLKMVDPLLLGIAIEKNNLIAAKSLVKNSPEERVGVFCKCNGVAKVIEYTELSKEMCELRDENGELVYGESHIMCNLFNIKALEKIAKEKLPYHSAFKKADYLDENKKIIVAKEPNAYKFEAFIFDAFESFKDMSILRVKREEEFAPVKNAEGVDSPKTAKILYENFWKK